MPFKSSFFKPALGDKACRSWSPQAVVFETGMASFGWPGAYSDLGLYELWSLSALG